MKRDIEKHLIAWKTDASRLPLLVRGARQVGKSFTVEKFGNEHFERCVTVNFEFEPRFIGCFEEGFDPRHIINLISVIGGKPIVPGKTLLFFDEIQLCPKAILSLRYFYEKLPELHVIGAGSLLEFALAAEDFRMPVGRVGYLYMYPLSLGEFLDATGRNEGRSVVRGAEIAHGIPDSLYEYFNGAVRLYMAIGGMPAVVNEYLSYQDIERCQKMQTVIAQTYRDDFGKYAGKTGIAHLQSVFMTAPRLVGRKFKYSAVDPDTQSRELKLALELLEKAGVVYKIRQTHGIGAPLEAGASDRNFKVIVLDVGLMQNLCGLKGEMLAARDILSVHAGAVAEQFAGQELIAYADPFSRAPIFYWAREERTSSAEVDYVLASGRNVLPIEVKSGKNGTLRSMHLFLKQYGAPLGVKLSQSRLQQDGPILSVPLFCIESLNRLIASVLDAT